MGDERPAAIISGSLDLEPEGVAVEAGRLDEEAEAGLAADGVVEAARAGPGAEAAQQPAGTATEGQLVAVPATAGAQADRPVEWRAQVLDGCALPPGWRVPRQHDGAAPLPGLEGVLADRRVGEAVAGEGLGEGLAGVLVIVDALVAWEEAPATSALADVLEAGPALGPPVDGGAEGGRQLAVRRDVVAVLMGEHVLERVAAAFDFLVAADHDSVFARVVAGLGTGAAVEGELVFGVELDGQQAHLRAVDQRADEARDPLRLDDRAVACAGLGDGHRDRRVAAVADRIAPRRRGGRDPRRRGVGTPQDDVALRRRPGRCRQEQDHGYARKRPRRAPAHGAGPGSIS